MIVFLFEDETFENFLPLTMQNQFSNSKAGFRPESIKQTRGDIELLKKLFRLTAKERRKARVVKRKFEL